MARPRPCSPSVRTTYAATDACSRDENGRVSAIVEAGDATPEQLAVREVNSSIYVFAAEKLWPALEKLEPANAQGELYLTDAIRFLVAEGELVGACVAGDPVETEGVNTRVEMAVAAADPARPHQHGAHARRGHHRRSGLDLDRAHASSSSPTRPSIPSAFCAEARASAAAPRSGRRLSRSTPRSARE